MYRLPGSRSKTKNIRNDLKWAEMFPMGLAVFKNCSSFKMLHEKTREKMSTHTEQVKLLFTTANAKKTDRKLFDETVSPPQFVARHFNRLVRVLPSSEFWMFCLIFQFISFSVVSFCFMENRKCNRNRKDKLWKASARWLIYDLRIDLMLLQFW